MFDFKNNLSVLIRRQTRHCVWIREHEGENARLIQLWIDPEMTAFETRTEAPEQVLASAEAGSPESDGDADGPASVQTEREGVALLGRLFRHSFALFFLIAGSFGYVLKAAPPRISQVALKLLF